MLWGHIPWRGLRGLTGGYGEKIKVPVGPQTVAVVGLCPLPLPSLTPHPVSGGQGEGSKNFSGSEYAGVCCHFGLIAPLVSVSLLVYCAVRAAWVSEFPHHFSSSSVLFVLPWALCVIVDWVECSCYFNELLWVSPYLLGSLPASHYQPLGPLFVSQNLCFSLCPPCSHLPCIHPWAPDCALQAPFRSKLVESLHSCQRPGCLLTGKKRN